MSPTLELIVKVDRIWNGVIARTAAMLFLIALLWVLS